MAFRWNRRRKRGSCRMSRRWPLVSMAVVLTGGFVWELIHLHTTLTMACESYYAQWTDGHTTGQSLLQTVALFVAALVLWWLADLFRPKPHRTAIFARLFEGLIMGAIVLATAIQWGLLFPESRVFPVANRILGVLQSPDPPVYWISYENIDGSWEEYVEVYDVSTLE